MGQPQRWENEISPDNIEFEEYNNDGRLKSVIDDIPGKNIFFSSDDIKNVLKVYDGVRTMVSEKNTTNINNKSAAITVVMLSEHTCYSQLSTRSVLRWHGTRDKMKTKPGRKIDQYFESEVWGKLMFAERSSINVSLLLNENKINKIMYDWNKFVEIYCRMHERTYINANERTYFD